MSSSTMSSGPLATELPLTVEPLRAPTSDQHRAEVLAEPGFGRHFTDHMLLVHWTPAEGWHDARLTEYGPIPMSPATAVLHYAQSIFEGLKAYRRPDGGIVTFRPEANAARLNRSAARMAMPAFDESAFVAAVDTLVRADADWVPGGGENSLYVRPLMFASESFLGVRPAKEYTFMLIASPAGAYFAGGVKPVSLYVSEDYSRAAPGGTGEAKCGGNYAASLLAQEQAIQEGCDQVVFLDAIEHRYVEELGGMNLFFVYGDPTGPDGPAGVELVTPELTGSLLAGITRESIMVLARERGYRVTERKVSIDEWRDGAASGAISETFACGTAAVITPIGEIKSASGDFTVAGGGSGAITMQLREHLMGIQHGTLPDDHGWIHRVL